MSIETQIGDHLRRIRKLEAVPAAAAAVQAARPVYGYTAVVGEHATPKKWPGAMRVIPAYGFAVSGTNVNGTGFAFNQLRRDETAATFAAATDLMSATVEDLLLTPGIRYQCWAAFKVAGGAATANIGIEATAIGTSELNLTGFPTTHGSLARLFSDKTFAAGETVTVKEYRTSGSGNVDLDQLYFFPSNASGNNTGPSAAMPACIPAIQIATFADLGPSATTATDDALWGSAVIDAQTANDLSTAEFSATSFLTAGALLNAASSARYYDEATLGRHHYVSARYDSTTDSENEDGCFVTKLEDGVPTAAARIFMPHAGFYYLGLSSPYGNPPQLYLWRNNCGPSTVIPYADCASANVNDVRVGQYFAITEYLDDYF